jgi:plastocyanin
VRLLAVPPTLCALLVAGCGGEDDGGRSRALTVPAGEPLRVVGDEYSFDPERVVVRGPGRLGVTLENRGDLAHNLRLVRDGAELGGTPTFPGGRSESGAVTLARGSYEMVCTVGDHAALGMVGALRVKE